MTWAQMEEVYKSGKAKAIGLANWSIPYLEELSKKWTVVPAVNEVELHPFLPQHDFKAWCQSRGILMEASSPLGSTGETCHIRVCAEEPKSQLTSPRRTPPVRPGIESLASKYGVSPATILISYHVNKDVVVLPKSVTPARISQNRGVVDLCKEDLEVLDRVAEHEGKAKRLNTPLWGFDLGFEDWYGPVEKRGGFAFRG